jgi:hypothetical protein
VTEKDQHPPHPVPQTTRLRAAETAEQSKRGKIAHGG